MAKITGFAALLLLPINCSAINYKTYVEKEYKESLKNGWIEINNDSESIMFGNPKTYATDSYGRPMLWYKVILKQNKTDFVMAKYMYVADCENKMLGFKHLISYDINNKINDKVEFPDYLVKMRTLDPDSINFQIMENLCSIKR